MNDTADKSVPQALLQTIESAMQYITAPGELSDEAAHETRKALKKARAGLRLLKRSVGDAAYRRENSALRSAARSVSPLRNAKARVDTLSSLCKRVGDRMPRKQLAALESRLRLQLVAERKRVQKSSGSLLKAARTLKRSRDRLRPLMNKRISASDLNAGLRRIHRQGRKAFAKTRNLPNAASLHEWRKKAKYLANAVGLLGDAPSTAVAATAKRAERIADWLGDDHDLFVLSQQLRSGPAATGKGRLRSFIDDRRIRLQRKALRCGKRLYAKKRRQAFEGHNGFV